MHEDRIDILDPTTVRPPCLDVECQIPRLYRLGFSVGVFRCSIAVLFEDVFVEIGGI